MQQTTNYPRYQLSDRSFHAEVEGGQLCSLKPGPGVAGQRETQYILPGRSFGELRMAWSQNGKEEEWLLEDKAVWSAQAPEYGAREVRYTAKAEKEGLPVTVEHRSVLADGIFRWEYRVKNISDKPLELLDFGMPFPCNTQLQEWGVSASDKVIGHNFIGGHGSHLVFERCDGQGPFLLALPQDGTALEYIAMEPDVRNKGVLIVYALSAKAVRAAKEKQTRRTVWGNSCTLQPGAEYVFAMRYVWAADYEDARKKFAENGLIDVEVLPGYTVPQGSSVSLALTSQWEDLEVKFPYPEETEVTEETCGNRKIYRLKFRHPGENIVYVQYAGDRWMPVSFFVTQPLKTLIEKRGAFIASHQHTDPEKWYYGLLAEWNNETGALLGPDNYDLITGWRIYEVTCDDPGLSKPAFLSGKLAEYPEPSQIEALDRYVENFVWGGLQCTEDEQFPYGIYGIPDWKQNRDSSDDGVRGKLHIWRIYDYPHISLMYYNLYRIARDYPDAPLSQTKETYLRRACATAVAMFTIPLELDHWDALKTGLYNELCIEKIIAALREEGMAGEADRLERHWERKMKFFVLECTDLFGSEYPFDTTGFESTHALAKHALKCAENTVREDRFSPPVLREQAENFMERQMAYNIACRGVLEPAYYWYGSDYRSTNATYTMSYMSQMGGWAILDYALKYADDPYALLRLGYGSVLSSWALVNAGEEKDNYGYWFPGKQNDGAASGGFEPLATGKIWLGQEHRGGPWMYSCEIDLGFCGGLRGAATVLADDPIFGQSCYGGEWKQKGDAVTVDSADGVSRRFHIVNDSGRLHCKIGKGHFVQEGSFVITGNVLEARIDPCGVKGAIPLEISSEGFGACTVSVNGTVLGEGESVKISLPEQMGPAAISVKFCKPLLP